MIVDFLVFPTRGPVYKDYRHCHEQKQRVDYSLWPTYPNASNRYWLCRLLVINYFTHSRLEDMNFRRERNIINVLNKLYELLESFQSGDRGCSLLCSSVWLGFLTRKMHSNGLLSSQLRSPFPEWSYEGLLQTLEEFEETFWLEQSCYRRSGECTDPDVMDFVHRFPSSLEGLLL